ncbi:hypothetical protein OPQ81_002278 [Rhizoctonia solani]|nr:hypothetical protein OPQ81_002278 [Rhizoctonia solani]
MFLAFRYLTALSDLAWWACIGTHFTRNQAKSNLTIVVVSTTLRQVNAQLNSLGEERGKLERLVALVTRKLGFIFGLGFTQIFPGSICWNIEALWSGHGHLPPGPANSGPKMSKGVPQVLV